AENQSLKPEEKLRDLGLPAIAASKIKTWALFWGQRSWHFILEAKGIKHQAHVSYRIKQIFKRKHSPQGLLTQSKTLDLTTNITKDEAYFLSRIKADLKDLSNYSGLAQIYIDDKNFSEARDIYSYLVKHDPGNADFHAKLGYANFLLEDFESAVKAY